MIVLTCCMLQTMPMVIAEVASPRERCAIEQLVRILPARRICAVRSSNCSDLLFLFRVQFKLTEPNLYAEIIVSHIPVAPQSGDCQSS